MDMRNRAVVLVAMAGLAGSVCAQTAEVEPNETKATATPVVLSGPGATITGNTTGASTTAGATSLDTFRVKTPAAALGIYRHRLVLTSSTLFHTGTIRGLSQTNRIINPGTDVVLQTSSTTSTPPRFVQWYGFGRQEEIYFRVTATTSSTADYTATYEQSPVTVVDLGNFFAGEITLGPAAGNTSDMDFWVYDSNLMPIATYGNDEPDVLTREYAPGVYYIAWALFAFGNDQPAAADDTWTTGTVLDFPNGAASGSSSTVANFGIKVTDPAAAVEIPLSKTPFEVVWLKFTAVAGGPATGACCLSDGTCQTRTQFQCSLIAGAAFQGAATVCGTCPQPGACCATDGTCSVIQGPACLAAGGVFGGPGTVCSAGGCPMPANTWVEQVDTGDLPATAQVTQGDGALTTIRGTLETPADVDMYKIRIVDAPNFNATAVGGVTYDTIMTLYSSTGHGVVYNDDTASGNLPSTITSALVGPAGNGEYYLALARYNKRPTAAGALIFPTTTTGQLGPTGPGGANPVDGWINTPTASAGPYQLTLAGAEFVESAPSGCYPNCDESTTAPVLNVQDFTCFLQRYAAGDSYANCDNSTVAPVLNVQDFTCFLQSYAAGCP
jgi:hypothetical protein